MPRETARRWEAPKTDRRRRLRGLAAAAGVLLALALVPLYVPAQTGTVTAVAPELRERFSQQTNNLLGRAMEGYAYIPKHYRISAGSLPARPAESGFGAAKDPAEVLAVIDAAAELLGGESVVGWTPETVLRPGSYVQYYYDETILVLTWQELHDERICTWCEVKLADASQLRRKLAGDRYGYPIQMPASELAQQDNAVAAVSGDFYAFRTAGIHVYDGTLYYVSGWSADTCFFTRSGDMKMVRQGEIGSWAEAYAYLADNDILFSMAFGPVLVENGENVTPWDYPWGEIQDAYARAALSQVGELHYLFLAANCDEEEFQRSTAWETAEMMLDHGCTMAYALDGGQTAEVILGGALVNRPEFGFERQVSDVLCFASALPEGGAS